MQFEASLAIEEMKESLAKSLREINPPGMDMLTQVVWTDAIVQTAWSAIDKCVEITQLDTNYQIDTLKAKAISREFEILHIARMQLLRLCGTCLEQIRALATAEQLATITQACVNEFTECTRAISATVDDASSPRAHESTVTVAKLCLEHCRRGDAASVHILADMIHLGICSHEELGTTSEEIAEFLRQKNTKN